MACGRTWPSAEEQHHVTHLHFWIVHWPRPDGRRFARQHSVVLHARNAKRAEAVRQEATQTEAIVVGDIETISGAKEVAAQVNALGHFDTVIHNAAVGYREGHRVTADGLPHVFAINTLSASGPSGSSI